jgi:hypothetical protein
MKVQTISLRRVLAACVGTVLALPAFAAEPAGWNLFDPGENYIRITGYGSSVSGSDAAYKAGTQTPNGGGIEALRINRTTEKDVAIKIEGRALLGSEDYLAKVNFAKDEVGSFDIGYKRFRTFYDGVGGFFPTNGRFMALTDRELHVDRARFWTEAKLTRPNLPVFTLKYAQETRDGRKDSTTWGSSSLTGLPYNLAPYPITPTRKFAPAYLNLDERHHTFEAKVEHHIGSTQVEVRYVAGKFDNSNTRYVTNFPGQVMPFPTPAAAALALMNPLTWNNQQGITQNDGIVNKHSALEFKTSTAIGEKLTFHAGGLYERARATMTGSRTLVATTPGASGVTLVTTTNYHDLAGTARVNAWVWNASLDYKPNDVFFAKIGVRGEELYTSARDTFNVLATTGTTPRIGWSKQDEDVLTPVVELRYTGIPKVALYASGSLLSADGVKRNSSTYNPLTAANGTLAINNNEDSRDQFTVGALWRPIAKFDARVELFRREASMAASGFEVRTGDYFRVDSEITGVKLSSTVRPIETVSVTGRYIYQQGDLTTAGYQPLFPTYDSGDATNHSIGGSLSWTPTDKFYVQLNGTMVFNRLRTGYGRVGYVPATSTVNSYDGDKVLQDSVNDYVTGSVVAGWVVGPATDASLQFSFYDAANSNANLATWTMPYGADVSEYLVAAGVKHRLNDKMILNAKLGYVENENGGTGGNTSYNGPLAALSVDYAF